jgi:hypothetical protein
MSALSLVDLPTEILEMILSDVSNKRHNDRTTDHRYIRPDKSYTFLFCLLFKKQTASFALKHLYRCTAKFYLEKEDQVVKLFTTLVLSVRGCTAIPYHLLVENFSDRPWRSFIPEREIDAFEYMQLLSSKLLQTGQLKDLSLRFPNDFVLKDTTATYNVSMLKSLFLYSGEIIKPGNATKTWMETLLPKLRLENLEIQAGWTRLGKFCCVSRPVTL